MKVSQNQSVWLTALSEAVTSEVEKTGVVPEQWRAGGRATKANPLKENGGWWADRGHQMVSDFEAWWTANNDWYVWLTPTGERAVEIALFSDFNGVPVRAFADLIAYDADGILSVVDFKTGAHMPNNGMQLGMYATLVEVLFGVRPQRGYYYDARNATMVRAEGMERWTKPVFDHLFTKFAKAVEEEIFLPSISMLCSSCSVNDYCYAYGGQLAQDVDPISYL